MLWLLAVAEVAASAAAEARGEMGATAPERSAFRADFPDTARLVDLLPADRPSRASHVTTLPPPAGTQRFYVTFGYAHSDPPGLLQSRYLVVCASDELTARAKVNEFLGENRWAFIYTEAEFLPQVDRYALRRWKELR